MVAGAMLKTLGSYRSVLYLTSAIALIELIMIVAFDVPNSVVIRFLMALIIVFGIWVQSIIIRYLGAAWLTFAAASAFWPLFVADRIVVDVWLIALITTGVLSLVTAFILVFSKNFSAEFTHEREVQPKYKGHLRWILFAVIAGLAVVATLQDIWRLILRSA
jgi:hypothetical protein